MHWPLPSGAPSKLVRVFLVVLHLPPRQYCFLAPSLRRLDRHIGLLGRYSAPTTAAVSAGPSAKPGTPSCARCTCSDAAIKEEPPKQQSDPSEGKRSAEGLLPIPCPIHGHTQPSGRSWR